MLVPANWNADVPQHVPKVRLHSDRAPLATERRRIRHRGAGGIRSRSRNGAPKFVWALLSCVRKRTHYAACNQQRFPEDNMDTELWVGSEENAALALFQNITIYALNLSQLREIRKRLMLPAGDNRFRYIAANSEHAP